MRCFGRASLVKSHDLALENAGHAAVKPVSASHSLKLFSLSVRIATGHTLSAQASATTESNSREQVNPSKEGPSLPPASEDSKSLDS